MFGAFLRWLSKLISGVPEEISACEFDCRKRECRMGDWSQCVRRQQAMSGTNRKRPDLFRHEMRYAGAGLNQGISARLP